MARPPDDEMTEAWSTQVDGSFAAARDPSEVRRVGPHELLEELGRGGMGVVYEVEPDAFPGVRYALKVLVEGDARVPAEAGSSLYGLR